MKRFTLLFASVLILALLSACGSKAPTLKFAPQVGDTYQVTSEMQQTMTQSLGGADMTITQHFIYGYDWTVQEITPEGNVVVGVTYNRIATEQTFGEQSLSYDSAKDATVPPELTGLDLMLGKGFTMTLSPQGNVVKIEGLDEMYRQIVEASDLPADQQQLFYEALQASYGEASLTEQFAQVLLPYPTEPLQEGMTWQSAFDLNGLVPVHIESTYTVQGWDDQAATVAITSSLKSDPETPSMLSGYEVVYDLTGASDGTFEVALADGITRQATLNQHLEGTMTLRQGDVELPVPLTIDTTFTYQMAKK